MISKEQVGGKATWEDTAEKREASLREQKTQMVLAARQYVFSYLLLSLLFLYISCFFSLALILELEAYTMFSPRRLLAQQQQEAKKEVTKS